MFIVVFVPIMTYTQKNFGLVGEKNGRAPLSDDLSYVGLYNSLDLIWCQQTSNKVYRDGISEKDYVNS